MRTLPTHSFRLLAPLLLVALASAALFAQDASARRPLSQYVHDHWTEKEGLPQNGVYSPLQSRDGYLWFGTEEGLVRFDGVRFTVFDRNNTKALKSAWIRFLREDEEGGIWISYSAQGKGAALYKDGVMRAYSTEDGLRSNNVAFVYETRDSSKWFVHVSRGVSRLKNGVMTTYGQAEGLPGDTVFAVGEDSKGNFWFATPQGMARYDGKSFMLVSTQNGLPQNRVWWINSGDCIFEDSRNNLWMATNAGLVCYGDGAIRTYTTSDGLLENRVYDIIEDREGTLWFVTTSGINSLSNGTIAAYRSPRSFESVNGCVAEADNTLWLATSRGLWRFRNGSFDGFGRENGMTDELLRSVFVDKEGSIWFGTEDEGLHRLREGKFVTYGKDRGLKDEVITCVFEDSRGNLWLGSPTGGIARLSGGTTTVFDEKAGLNREVRGVCEGPDGTLWFAAIDGLHTLRNGKTAKYSMGPGPDSTQLRDFIFRKSGDRVVADFHAVYHLKNGRWERLFPQTIAGGISTVAEDAGGNLWIGTYETGVWLYANESLTQFTANQGYVGTPRILRVPGPGRECLDRDRRRRRVSVPAGKVHTVYSGNRVL